MPNVYLFPQLQFLTNNGDPNSGGKISTFVAGTTTPLASYTDSTGATPAANPIVLNSAGRPNNGGGIWVTASAYKFVITKSDGTDPYTIDGINITVAAASPYAGLTDTGDLTMQQATAATGSANQNSNNLKLQGTIWNGAASVADIWNWQIVEGTGSNPTSTLTLTHSGSTGTVTISIPSAAVSLGSTLAVAGATTLASVSATSVTNTGDEILSSGKVIKWNNDAGLSRTAAATVAVGSGAQGDSTGTVVATTFKQGSSSLNIVDALGVDHLFVSGSSPFTNTFIGGNGSGGTIIGSIAAGGSISISDTKGNGIGFLGSTSGTTTVVPAAIASGTLTMPAATDTLVGKATTDILTNKTLTSPVINGTPTGTGIPTVTLKKGSGAGNYTSASTTYVVVDSTNLCYTVTIPTGWKLAIRASGTALTATAAVQVSVALSDNAACGTNNAGILLETPILAPSTGNGATFALDWVINGDGAAHNIALQYKTANGADSATIINSTATFVPTMVFLLTPSN